MIDIKKLLPPSTNSAYEGSIVSVFLLGFFALTSIIPGLIHQYLPDGGAGVIAGMDLSVNGEQTIGIFAWAGTTQFVWGCMLLAIAIHYRSLTSLALVLILIERIMSAVNIWLLKPKTQPMGLGEHHPPEAYAILVMIPIVMLCVYLATPRKL